MKKYALIIILCVIVSSLTGCSALEKDESRISELRDGVFFAVGEDIEVSLITGVREEPFTPDGQSGEKREFSLLTILPKKANASILYSFELIYGDRVYGGEMNKHPLKNSFSYEIDERITEACSVTIIAPNYAQTFSLKSVIDEEFITADEAYRIAKKELRSPNGEIFVRLLQNPLTPSGEGYYWYIAFVESNYRIKAVLIEPISKEIVAKRE